MTPMNIVREDFDRIASVSLDDSDNYNPYYSFLLRHVPSTCHAALEIGCGSGAFSRLLSCRAERVLALDLSPNMIASAIQQSSHLSNISFTVADILNTELSPEEFDCIVSIATLHHLPMETVLLKLKKALKVNGRLIILDLFQSDGLVDYFTSALALPVSMGLRLMNTGRLRPKPEVRKAWAEHARNDSYLTMNEVRSVCERILPGAQVRKHLLWRYSIIWKKS